MPILWAVSILWDLLTNCITIILIIILVALSDHDDWKQELGTIFLLMFFYNFAMVPWICLLSLIFSKPSLGMVIVTFSNFVFGMYNVHESCIKSHWTYDVEQLTQLFGNLYLKWW